VVGIDLAGLVKGGIGRYSMAELRHDLNAHGLETSGDKCCLASNVLPSANQLCLYAW